MDELPEQQARVQSLAREYIALVKAMRNGQYADHDEWQALSSQRSLVHDELIVFTGVTERS